MKGILVPVENNDVMPSVLQTSLLLARRFGSYIEGFALLPNKMNEFIAADVTGSIALASIEQGSAEEARHARSTFESFMQSHSVAAQPAPDTTSFGWLDQAAEGESFVGSYARVFDVTVLGRPDGNSTGLHIKALESALFDSGRPVLIAPPSPPQQMGDNILIAWNGSPEQSRTIALAMPLLAKARRVAVLTVEGGAGVPGPSAAQVLRYLQRNGVAAEQMAVGLDGHSTGEAILESADKLGFDLLLKGAYTQSRLRQLIFGGATRHILANAKLPVLMAH
jgi:nucleotide-binding universal stress UspA family protein